MDYYLRTTSKQAFLQDLASLGLEIDLENNYYQDENIIIDWIGKIPNEIETDEDGNLIGEITYKSGYHVNIRCSGNFDCSLLTSTESVYPDLPYRMFS